MEELKEDKTRMETELASRETEIADLRARHADKSKTDCVKLRSELALSKSYAVLFT